MALRIEQGDATSPRPSTDNGVIIAHLCNNAGQWGRGFVLALNKMSHVPVGAYRSLAADSQENISLGTVQMVEVQPDLWVANMIAQENIKPVDPPVQYSELKKCLDVVMKRAKALNCSVHIPAGMGAGLAGGDRTLIHQMIEDAANAHSMLDNVVLWEFADTSAQSYVKQTHEK